MAAPVARVIKFWDMPMMTPGAFARDFSLPKTKFDDEYYLLTRMGISYYSVMEAVIHKGLQMSWRKYFIIYDSKAYQELEPKDHCVLLLKSFIEAGRTKNITNFQTQKIYDKTFTFDVALSLLENEVGIDFGGKYKFLFMLSMKESLQHEVSCSSVLLTECACWLLLAWWMLCK